MNIMNNIADCQRIQSVLFSHNLVATLQECHTLWDVVSDNLYDSWTDISDMTDECIYDKIEMNCGDTVEWQSQHTNQSYL